MRRVWVAVLLLATALLDGAGAEDWTREVMRVKQWLQHGQASSALRKSKPAALEHYLQVVEVRVRVRVSTATPLSERCNILPDVICRGLLPCAAHGGTARDQQAAGGRDRLRLEAAREPPAAGGCARPALSQICMRWREDGC